MLYELDYKFILVFMKILNDLPPHSYLSLVSDLDSK